MSFSGIDKNKVLVYHNLLATNREKIFFLFERKVMDSGKDGFLWRFKWHILIICVALAVVVALTLFTDVFQKSEADLLNQLIWLLGALVFLIGLLAMLSRSLPSSSTGISS